MNVHLLRHLTYYVRSWGPLWAFSCFGFESINGDLKKFFHGTTNMSEQVPSYMYVSYCTHTQIRSHVQYFGCVWYCDYVNLILIDGYLVHAFPMFTSFIKYTEAESEL